MRKPPKLLKPPRAGEGMRRLWHAAVVWVLVPLIVLALLEGILRVAGYGYSVALFVKKSDHGVPMYVANPHAARRYFPRAVARAPLPEFFAARKAPGSLRVFVFGESAVVGECYQDVSLTRMLEVMLQHALPGRTVEVINAGITAINSWAILPFVRECVHYEPDVFVLYVGNNEVIGPYGPGLAGVAVGGRMLIAARQWVSSLKLYQLAQALGEAVGTRRHAPRWRGMELFAGHTWHPADARVRRTWRQLAVNLAQMRAAAQQRGIPVIICTLAANLQDCPPFASLHDSALPPTRRDVCARETQRGWELLARGAYTAACAAFSNALAADQWYADARYGYAHACHALDTTNASLSAYASACAADALQFRPPAYVNADIRAAFPDTCADVEQACVAASPAGVPGAPLLYDHVHFTLQGNYLAASTIYAAVAHTVGADPKNVMSLDALTHALAFTVFDERAALRTQRDFLRQPVFVRQRGHAERLQALERARDAAHAAVASQGFARLVAMYHAALSNRPADHNLWLRFGNLCAEFGELIQATNALYCALTSNPWDVQGYYDLAHVLTRLSATNEAVTVLMQAESVQPGAPATAAALGAAYRACGDHAAALRWLARADARKPGSPDILCERGNALLAAGDPRAAIAAYTDALTAYPEYVPALNNRGTAYAQLGMYDVALSNFTAALALDPQHAEACNNRGKTFAAQQDYVRAAADFARAAELQPHYAEAWSNLGAARAMLHDMAGAEEAYSCAIAADASYADAYFNRANARAARGELRGALADLDAYLTLRPDDAAARAARAEIASALQSQ